MGTKRRLTPPFSIPSHDGFLYTFLFDAPALFYSFFFFFYFIDFVDARQFQSRGMGIQIMVSVDTLIGI